MKRHFLLASTPIFLGIILLIIRWMIGDSIEADGTLVEPFFLVVLFYLLILIGIISLSSVAILSIFKKHNQINN